MHENAVEGQRDDLFNIQLYVLRDHLHTRDLGTVAAAAERARSLGAMMPGLCASPSATMADRHRRRLRGVASQLRLPSAAAAAAQQQQQHPPPPQQQPATPRAPPVPGTSFTPARTSDPQEALRLLRRDGGVVFRAVPEGVTLSEREQQAMAATVPRTVFGDELAQIKMPSRLAGGGWDGQKWQGWLSPASVDRGHLPNKPHMDGGSELKSDYFLMFCGECANTGGDYIGSGGDGGSILLDGYDILDSLPQQQRSDFFTVPTQSRGYIEGGR
jgi:hypothetical protein